MNTSFFQSLDRKWVASFVSHAKKFIMAHGLYSQGQKVWVGVSGGADSMALVALCEILKNRGFFSEVHYLHIHHNSRLGQDQEEQWLQAQFKKLGLKLMVRKVLWKITPKTNFEQVARQERYKIFQSVMKAGDIFLLGHHLDDSFEWSLMQKLRSSHLKSTLGIPVKRGVFRRPLLCVSRAQIETFLKQCGLDYLNDPTNQDLKYERNYLRHQVIPKMKERHPNYLKHYVEQSQALAQKLGLTTQKKSSDVKIISHPDCTYFLDESYKNEFSSCEEILLQEIHRLSQASRGTLALQVKKILMAAKNGKHGPLSLSGGLVCYLSSHVILLTRQQLIGMPKKFSSLPELKPTTIKELKQNLQAKLSQTDSYQQFPFFVALTTKASALKKKKKHILFEAPNLPRQENEIYYWPALELLNRWDDNKILKKQRVLLGFV
ncbi:MAG: tRNA lysidine(34) synthetase TilS [Bacteriovoracaceae bacterium]|nr:tRNA lysidine(34) synthetase TilS [Bacteriovoracaceae bacterium]